MAELKNCPFCGGEAQVATEHRYIGGHSNGISRLYIQCKKCANRTMSYDHDDRKEMYKAWNARVND